MLVFDSVRVPDIVTQLILIAQIVNLLLRCVQSDQRLVTIVYVLSVSTTHSSLLKCT